MTDSRFDLIVIGGGIIGLSVAMETTRRFPDLRLLVIEKENQVGFHQSSRNSGVIHSGIYHLPESLKARMCIEGAAAMVEFCRAHGIPFDLCGKVVVATNERELQGLDELYRRGTANGVRELAMIGPEKLREIEPHARGIRALHVPGTGVTDYGAVTAKYAEIVRANGGEVRIGARVTGLKRRAGETVVETTVGSFLTRHLVNCAGLHSDRIARMAGAQVDVIIVPFRGEYYELVPERQHLVRSLIYPVPDPELPFLGVHFTRKIHGGIEAGPNAVLAFEREGYRWGNFSLTDTVATLTYPGFWRMARTYWRSGIGEFYRSRSKKAFVNALRKLLPGLGPTDIRPGGAGVRAQALSRAGALLDDFYFVQTEGMVHVCNVPSPAATASIPIGRKIVDMMQEAFGMRPKD